MGESMGNSTPLLIPISICFRVQPARNLPGGCPARSSSSNWPDVASPPVATRRIASGPMWSLFDIDKMSANGRFGRDQYDRFATKIDRGTPDIFAASALYCNAFIYPACAGTDCAYV